MLEQQITGSKDRTVAHFSQPRSNLTPFKNRLKIWQFDLLDFPAHMQGELTALKHAGRTYRTNRDPFTKRGASVLELYDADGHATRLEPIGVFIETPGMEEFSQKINAGFEAESPAPFAAHLAARNAMG